MAPDTTRVINIAAADARRAIEALQEQSTSLQRELAEAKAAFDRLHTIVETCVMGLENGDCNKLVQSLAADFWKLDNEIIKLAPGPSDAKGGEVPAEPLPVKVHRKLEAIAESLEVKDWQAAGTSTLATLIAEAITKLKSTPAEPAQKLVPLTEGARVFVPKGPRRVPKCREYFFDPIWGHGVFQALWDYDARAVKVQICELLDPALYGVPAERVGGKQVPDGWLLLKPDTVNYHIGWLGKYYAVVDPETMPATTSNLDDCEACLDDCNALVADLRKSLQDERMFAEKKQSEAERLRKAIEEHREAMLNKGLDGTHDCDDRLWSALSPSPAAAGVVQVGPYKGYSGRAEFDDDAGHFHGEVTGIRDVVTFVGDSTITLQAAFEASVDDYLEFKPSPAAASKCPALTEEGQKILCEGAMELFPDLFPAPAAASGEKPAMESAWLLETHIGGSPVWYTSHNPCRHFTTDACAADKFRGKDEAEKFASNIGLPRDWKATEHGFDSSPVPATDYLTKMADAEDAAGDVSIGTSAPAAESGGKTAMNQSDYPRCKTCKWWAPNFNNKPALAGGSFPFACRREIDRADFMCDPGDGAISDEGMLLTGPDFGCVHWEAKDVSIMAVDAMSKAFDALIDPKPGDSQER